VGRPGLTTIFVQENVDNYTGAGCIGANPEEAPEDNDSLGCFFLWRCLLSVYVWEIIGTCGLLAFSNSCSTDLRKCQMAR